MTDAPLVVPIHCDALVVNKAVAARNTFRWWQFNYISLSQFKSPEAVAGSDDVGTAHPGVYLQWTLPRGLRQGTQNRTTGAIDYPLVPNRWLIVRLSGTQPRQVKAWVLEGDCPFTAKVKSQDSTQSTLYLAYPDLIRLWKGSSDPYRNGVTLDPASTAVQWQKIGVRFPLDQGWSERAADTMFLTAVGPSNPVFSAYYPHNTGVFSFYDDVAEIDKDTLSYLVVGWYSDPSKDALASWPQDKSTDKPFEALLKRLNWQMIAGSDQQPTASLYQAAVFSVDWDRNGAVPVNDPLETTRAGKQPLNVAVGNTTIDAFTALIAAQTGSQQKADLLRAFQYDFLNLLNQVNGEALLEQRIRQNWFGTKPGGYVWTIVAKESDGSAAAALTESETQWLGELNRDQAALDAALNELFSHQWDLNAAWFKSGWLASNTFGGAPDGISDDQLAAFQQKLADTIDPSQPESLAAHTIAQIRSVKTALAKVPQSNWTSAANAQDAFEQGIAAFAARKGISSSNILKAVTAPRFALANNPVLLISGVEPSEASDPNQEAQVRPATKLATAFQAGGKTIDAASIAAAMPALPGAAGLPAAAQSLYAEFILLDPAGAAAIAAAVELPVEQVAAVMSAHSAADYKGTLPGNDLAPWAQPWQPMFAEWRASFSAIPYQSNGQRNWVFDGTDYALNAQGVSITADDRVVGGISLLSPHTQFVFASRLNDFVKKFGAGTELADLDAWIARIFDWKFLAQEMTGFSDALALRDHRTHRLPVATDTIAIDGAQVPIADVVGHRLGSSPAPGAPLGEFAMPAPYRNQVQSIPFIPNGGALPFHGVRQGQLYFNELFLYDSFGRKLSLISSGNSSGLFDYQNFPVLMDAALRPGPKLHPDVNSVIQLPPRVLQHARLDFSLVDALNDQKLTQIDPGANPICGWILPNHLDRSILVFAADGTSLGEFRLLETPKGDKTGAWQPPPHRDITLDDVTRIAPKLAQMLAASALGLQANFEAFLSAIDSTLWTIDPLGDRSDQNLSVLIGRPLALVRARLQFQLDGRPVRDTGWAATFDTGDPEFVSYLYSIRLGDQATRQDGVIGYFFGEDYTHFNSVVTPDTTTTQSYITPIGPVGTAGGGNYIELPFKDGNAAYVTLLIDPRARAHAFTGILPVKQLDIPARFLERPLANMEASFRMGPIITLLQPAPNQGAQTPAFAQTITFPLPSEQNGVWSWWEKNATPASPSQAWTGYGLVAATPNAQLKDISNTVREGFFQLVPGRPKGA